MSERIAIKSLSVSDLTFFDTFFKRSNVGNQKAINLNKDVFADVFYPSFAEAAMGKETEISVRVTVFGPHIGNPYRFARSITKKPGYKNWRLNGAAVPDPDDEQGKFDKLVTGDIAVIEFCGESQPVEVRIVIVASLIDPAIHAEVSAEVPGGRRSMVQVSRDRLSEIANRSAAPANHPLRELLDDPELNQILDEAQLGLVEATARLRERPGRRVTKTDLIEARERADRIGADGEALANIMLWEMHCSGEFPEFEWSSQEDAASSWDFLTKETPELRLDAKSTTGIFERVFFLSSAEAVAAASTVNPYRIVRIYDLNDDGAKARISNDINELAMLLIEQRSAMPEGVTLTGYTVAPSILTWGPEIQIVRPDEPS